MLNYSFYTESYKGSTITSPDMFDRYIVKASKYYSRLDSLWCIEYDTETDRDMAICAIADNLYELDKRSKNTLKSESDGSYSVTYGDNVSFDSLVMQDISFYVLVYRGG